MFGAPTTFLYPSNLSTELDDDRRESGLIARIHDTSSLSFSKYVIFNCDSIAFTYLLDTLMYSRVRCLSEQCQFSFYNFSLYSQSTLMNCKIHKKYKDGQFLVSRKYHNE